MYDIRAISNCSKEVENSERVEQDPLQKCDCISKSEIPTFERRVDEKRNLDMRSAQSVLRIEFYYLSRVLARNNMDINLVFQVNKDIEQAKGSPTLGASMMKVHYARFIRQRGTPYFSTVLHTSS